MEFDVLDPNLYAGDPFPAYAELRRHAPIYWDAKNECWVLSKYEDVVYVSKNPKIFSSAQGVMADADIMISIVSMDDPRHAQLRKVVSAGFTPRMVRALKSRIDEITTSCIDAIADRGECDFVHALAVPLPLLVIAEMLGVHHEDYARFEHWSDTMIVAAGQNDNLEILERASQSYVEFAEYMQGVFAERRVEPREDLVTVLVDAERGGILATNEDNISLDELHMFMTLLLVAGNETTRNAISGGLLALSEWPEEKAKLLANPGLIDSAAEEILRWVSPIVGFRRTATEDTVIRGQKIEKGQKVVMLYQSANRDEDVFGDADVFRIDRKPNDHVAFGIGAHFCLGANLARFEIRVALSEVLRRLPDIRVRPGVGPERVLSPLVRGIQSLPVVYTPENRSAAT
ncbi:MAG: cytochrome P450 [Deltaproteobacteria bacterium]|nr:cytochrome P450 [Deltaproteobacteria bacterium]